MVGGYVMSIDNGLTTTKAVIFNLDGHEIAAGVVDTVIENKGDWAEIDMELQWKNTVSVIQAVLAKSGINAAEIIGIGNSGHGAGVYLLDQYGSPVRKAISSMDGRAADIIENWRRNGITNYSLTYQNMWLGQPVPLLYWLKQNEPANYQKVHTILMAKDWIRYRLTGELNLEYTDASNSGLVNLMAKALDPEIFGPYGVSENYDKLPPLRKSMAIAGFVTKKAALETGLKEQTPVMGDCLMWSLAPWAAGFMIISNTVLPPEPGILIPG